MRLRLALVLGLIATGCGSNPGPSCKVTAAATCPAPAPSYMTDVAPVLKEICATCHSPGQMTGTIPLNNHVQVYARREEMLQQLTTCEMPPKDGVPATDAQMKIMLDWLTCGAPSN